MIVKLSTTWQASMNQECMTTSRKSLLHMVIFKGCLMAVKSTGLRFKIDYKGPQMRYFQNSH
jgi:hypothetical protein